MCVLSLKTTSGEQVSFEVDLSNPALMPTSESVYNDTLEANGGASLDKSEVFQLFYTLFDNFRYNYEVPRENDHRMLSFYTYLAIEWLNQHDIEIKSGETYAFPDLVIEHGLSEGFIANKEVIRISVGMVGYSHNIHLDCYLDDYIDESSDAFLKDCKEQGFEIGDVLSRISNSISDAFSASDHEVAASNVNLGNDVLRMAVAAEAFNKDTQHVDFDKVISFFAGVETPVTPKNRTLH